MSRTLNSGPKGPAQQQLDMLDSVFGPDYFEQGRLVVTVARDLPGLMKVAHKLQAKVNEGFGGIVEVIMEHIKYEWWLKLHETTTTVGLHKGQEVSDVQVTNIPDGIRVHPYKREHMPTLEILLLWGQRRNGEDVVGTVQGHCIYSMQHPETPSLEQVDKIFAQVEPYFAKRWISVTPQLAPPIRGEFEDLNANLAPGGGSAGAADAGEDRSVGAGVPLTILACHAYGFARDHREEVAHVTQCQPLTFRGVTDSTGSARICFLPAEVNKIQVAETSAFYGSEVTLLKAKMRALGEGPTTVPVELTPKALAVVTIHVFEMPRKLPLADETDGIIDWASEERKGLDGPPIVDITPMKDGEPPVRLKGKGGGVFVAEGFGLPEGCVSLSASCTGYESEEKALFLLVGENEFFVPLRRLGAGGY